MKVLVVGSGGREHALAWHLARYGLDVRVAPGNGGTRRRETIEVSDIDGLIGLARKQAIDLTIVGPEAPLAMGLVDRFAACGLTAFGPTRLAARLEWSKAWTKELLLGSGIPTATARIVQTQAEARTAIARTGLPVVLKADGLAGGKGVFVATTPAEVDAALWVLFERLGEPGKTVLVEQYLEGLELSLLAFTDGERLAVMPPARDYKRLLDDDRGPNTGGMGGYTRPEYATPALLEEVERTVLRPTLAAMAAQGNLYTGILYAGLMLTREGPKVLEYNCRFGDPECQLILPLLETNLSEVCQSVIEGRLEPESVHWRDGRTYGVVVAARGYPDAPEPGDPISGLDDLPDGVIPFHAGTRVGDDGRLLTAGGRVLTLVGADRASVVRAAESVVFRGKQFRRDIGLDVRRPVGATV